MRYLNPQCRDLIYRAMCRGWDEFIKEIERREFENNLTIKTMNKLQLFQHDQFGQIRVATNENGEPLFCLADLCRSLGLSNNRKVKSQLDDDVTLSYPIVDALGRNQQATFVNESGMYTVILRSDSPLARPMQKWVTSEVLPSVRKHGGYLTPQKIEEVLTNPDTIIQLATKLKEEQAKNKAMQPKALFADAVATSDRSCLVSELAKILNQNGVNIGEKRLFHWLRENGFLCRKGDYYNQPTQRAMDIGLFEIKKTAITRSDGSVTTTTTSKVTGKGQIYFVNKFLNRGIA